MIFRKYIQNLDGATAVEYALIAAGISVAIMAAVFLFGEALSNLFYNTLPDILSSE